MKAVFVVLAFLLASTASLSAQLSVKTNLLYDAMTTPNIGAEVGIGQRNTFSLVYGLNPWDFKDSEGTVRKAKHWVLMPEYRWWMCTRYNGHFLGVHALAGQFNAANVNLPVPGLFFAGDNIRKDARHQRVEGTFAGAGFTYGYQWQLSRHWNFEAEAGIGYAHVWDRKYSCGVCSKKLSSGHSNYFGVTKLGASVIYIF